MLGFNGLSRRWALAPLTALLLVALAMPALAADAPAIPLDENGLPAWSIVQWENFPVEITLPDHADLDRLLQAVPLKAFDREQVSVQFEDPKHYHLVFRPRVTEDEVAALEAAGYACKRVFDEERAAREAAEKAWAQNYPMSGRALREGIKTFNYWPTEPEVGTFLQDLANDYPNLARHFTYGTSVQGRDLEGIVISDNVNDTEPEPEVRLAATIHGNEPPGLIMQLNFAEYLLSNYGQPGHEDVTDLVDNYEIHIMPLHNPDGYVADQRYNANGVDLNRNFPEPDPLHDVQEIETVNFMNYGENHHFVLSTMSHSGALVMNYEWDHTYTLAPDDAGLQLLSLEYSTYNLPMYNGNFPQGITNGAAWYLISGSLQDWVYDQTGCWDITSELSNIKWPSAGALAGLWDDNRESLMHFTKAARYGVNGVVTGSDTGLPLDATVTVTGIDKSVSTDPEHGDYYKLLHTGTFDITFEAEGYITRTIQGVSTTWGTPTVLNVVLDPLAHGDVAGTVTNNQGEGLTASVNFYTYPLGEYVTTVATGAGNGGAYTAHLVYGAYTAEAVANGYVTQSAVITIGEEPITQDFSLAAAENVVLVSDDFESGLGLWTGGWGLSDPAEGYNSANSLNDSPGSTYPDNSNNTMTLAESLDLSDAMEGTISFMAKWHLESDWDGCFFEISTDGGTEWTPLATGFTSGSSGMGGQLPGGFPIFEGERANWVANEVDLAPYLGQQNVLLRFRLVSDSSVHYSGFYLDDFEVMVVREESSLSPVPGAEVLAAAVEAWPNPFNPQTTVKFTNPVAGPVNVGIYDVQGRLIRTLVRADLAAGDHSRVWDGRAADGGRAASGVYFARMMAGDKVAGTKLLMVK